MKNALKVGLVGVGSWGKNLLHTLTALDALGAIVETDDAKRAELSRSHPGVRIHEHLAQMLDHEISAIAVATPAPTHYRVVKQALQAGKDVFVEKPLTLSLHEASELVELSRERRSILMVGHILLYQPAVRWMKSFLDRGGLGRIFSLHHTRLVLGRTQRSESALWDLGVHDLAVILNVVDSPVVSVTVEGHGQIRPSVQDDIYLHLRFANGVRAHLHTSSLWPDKECRMTVIGEKGMLGYDDLAQTVTLHRSFVDENQHLVAQGKEVVFSRPSAPLHLELDHFLRRVKDRRAPLSDGESALEVVRLMARVDAQAEAR